MLTYELTPGIKSKSYRILENGVELARNFCKKTALIICKKHNTLLEKTNDFSGDLPIQPEQPIYPTDEETIGGTDNSDGVRDGDTFRQSDQILEEIFESQRESDRCSERFLQEIFEHQRESDRCSERIAEEDAKINSILSQLSHNSELNLARIRGQAELFSQTAYVGSRRLEQETVDTTAETV